MRKQNFMSNHHTRSISATLSTWRFEHYHEISFSQLVNPSHTNESWQGRNTCLWIYAMTLFIEYSGEH